MPDTSIHKPTNIIYTGVAGTGKTYRLLQIAKQYTDYLPRANDEDLLKQLLQALSWRDVVCLIFLDLQSNHQDLVKVPEIVSHEFFVAKASQNARESNLSSTAWLELRRHSPADSKTVSFENRASQAYFDKDNSGAWYLLPESMALLTGLSQQLEEFQQAKRDNNTSQNQVFSQQRFSMVSFHQAYGYEEFVEGIRPVMAASSQSNNLNNGASQMSYAIQDGAFLTLCQRAANNPKQRYAMLIDEINRANVSRVFGELLSLIESDKRTGMANAMTINLAYSGRTFSVPANVDIYATMNTQDYSLAPLDMALRRRFRFVDCPPQPELLPMISFNTKEVEAPKTFASDDSEIIDLARLLTGLNRRIIETLGVDSQLGHAFLFSVTSLEQLQSALVEQIIPQLVQATGGQVSALQYIFKDAQQPLSAQFIQDSQALVANDENHQIGMKNNLTAQGQVLSGHNSWLGQSINTGGYKINDDLVTKTGEFTKPITYQRLY